MSDAVIRVENLGKKYIIGHQQDAQRYIALRDVIANGAKGLVQRFQKSNFHNTKSEEFWALKDVSFEIKQGERVGIIGRNGAGKSTLLKILSRITEPTTGRIGIKGRVASLLEVGTGFHPELTGRENIFLNGAILGMSKAEIHRNFDEIVAFAEVEKFLDTPVKRYSSGMYVRLAFSVAAHLEPEILIVDEVLAVGDSQFQKKCLGKMENVAKEGRTVLFVSHNMGVIQTLCSRVILLHAGEVLLDDFTEKGVNTYLKNMESSASQDLLHRKERRGKREIQLAKIEISSGEDSEALATGRPARFLFHVTGKLPGLACVFTLYNQLGQPIANFNSSISSAHDAQNSTMENRVLCEIDELPLLPGQYRLNAMLMGNGEIQDHVEAAAIFDVEPGEMRGRPVMNENSYSTVCIGHRWVMPV
ncbi:MAG: ABC transporter ATP-binding protein [Leptolyngbyaceae cyanobacterium MO_188.B28]|nr:ABC transporter ATP-binding protein [Leptolyngbyaceae cyanobacterium MO_188.B28]